MTNGFENLANEFMDKSVTFTAEALIASMKEFYDSILSNPKLGSLRA